MQKMGKKGQKKKGKKRRGEKEKNKRREKETKRKRKQTGPLRRSTVGAVWVSGAGAALQDSHKAAAVCFLQPQELFLTLPRPPSSVIPKSRRGFTVARCVTISVFMAVVGSVFCRQTAKMWKRGVKYSCLCSYRAPDGRDLTDHPVPTHRLSAPTSSRCLRAPFVALGTSEDGAPALLLLGVWLHGSEWEALQMAAGEEPPAPCVITAAQPRAWQI